MCTVEVCAENKEYMAAGIPVLKRPYEEAGSISHYRYLTSSKLQWHQSSMLFEECPRYNFKTCNCNRLQQVTTGGMVKPPEILEEQGCVIFGKSHQFLNSHPSPEPTTMGFTITVTSILP